MASIRIYFLVCFAICPCFSVRAVYDFELNGQVKTMSRNSYRYAILDSITLKLDSTASPGSNWIYHFDKKGNRVRSFSYEPDDAPRGSYSYKYNGCNADTREVRFDKDGKENARGKKKYKGCNILSWDFESFQLIIKQRYSYDNANRLIRETEFLVHKRLGGNNDTNLLTTDYFYDDAGNLVRKFIQGNSYKEKIRQSFVYEYNAANQLIVRDEYGYDDSLWYHELYDYDSRGNRLEEQRYLGNGELKYIIKWTYDEHSNETSRINFAPDGSVRQTWEYRYTYDSHGNWITQHYFLNGLPYSVEHRTFEYY